jgi:hypothetical protein
MSAPFSVLTQTDDPMVDPGVTALWDARLRAATQPGPDAIYVYVDLSGSSDVGGSRLVPRAARVARQFPLDLADGAQDAYRERLIPECLRGTPSWVPLAPDWSAFVRFPASSPTVLPQRDSLAREAGERELVEHLVERVRAIEGVAAVYYEFGPDGWDIWTVTERWDLQTEHAIYDAEFEALTQLTDARVDFHLVVRDGHRHQDLPGAATLLWSAQ